MKPKPKHPGGRPAKITLQVIEGIGEKIAKGMTEEQACLLLNVKLASFQTARRRNPQFEAAINREKARFLDVALSTIRGGKDWVGYAWILERRHRPQFNRMDATVLAVANGGVLTAEDAKELERIAKEMFTGGAK